jgi:membrane protease YdiL (CAAX protease family)
MSDAVAAHFVAHRQRDRWSFFWRITLEGVLASLLAVAAASIVLAAASSVMRMDSRTDLKRMSALQLIVVVCVVAPIVETLLLQTLPVAIMRACRQRFWIQVIASTGPFAALHFPASFTAGIGAGLAGGFYFAFTYVHWREKSLAHAIWMTAATHATRNTLAVALLLLAKHLAPLKMVPH